MKELEQIEGFMCGELALLELELFLRLELIRSLAPT